MDNREPSLLAHYLKSLDGKPIDAAAEAAIAVYASLDRVRRVAPSVVESIIKEFRDQRTNLKLIASENFSSLETQFARAYRDPTSPKGKCLPDATS